MKKVISFLLVLTMCFTLLAGCNSETPKETEPEKFVTTTFIAEGKSDYVIVYDGSLEGADFARELVTVLSQTYGVAFEAKDASEGENACEIIVGNGRDIAKKTVDKLKKPFDFALKVEENALVLCAVNALSYDYLLEYLSREVFTEGEVNLTLSSEDNLFYTESPLMEYTYVDYLAQGGKSFQLADVFDWGFYENADTRLPYRLYVPFNYDPQKQYPVLVHLHGAGLRGDDNMRHLMRLDIPMASPEVNLDDAIIVSPQCPENQKWVDSNWGAGKYLLDNTPESNELKAVVELVGQLQETYNVDAGRIYACGFSMGGYGTWNLLLNHPDLFCAGIPMCGGGDPTKADILRDIPVWAIHGAMDPTVPVAGSRDMVEAIKAAGGEKVLYTELPDHEHDVWNYTYESSEMFAWLMSQRKENG